MKHLTCLEVQTQLGSYVDRTLSPDSARAVEAHLGSCNLCAVATAELASVDRDLRDVFIPGPTSAEWRELVARAQVRPSPRWSPLVAAAVVAIAVPLSLAAWLEKRETRLGYDVWTPGVDMEF